MASCKQIFWWLSEAFNWNDLQALSVLIAMLEVIVRNVISAHLKREKSWCRILVWKLIKSFVRISFAVRTRPSSANFSLSIWFNIRRIQWMKRTLFTFNGDNLKREEEREIIISFDSHILLLNFVVPRVLQTADKARLHLQRRQCVTEKLVRRATKFVFFFRHLRLDSLQFSLNRISCCEGNKNLRFHSVAASDTNAIAEFKQLFWEANDAGVKRDNLWVAPAKH